MTATTSTRGGAPGGSSKLFRVGLWLAIAALVIGILAGPLTGLGVLPLMAGLLLVLVAGVCAVIAFILGLIRFVRTVRAGDRPAAWRAAGIMVLALMVIAPVLGAVRDGRSYPALHDITTDLDDPPAFSTIRLREDLKAQVPARGRPDLDPLSNEERWRALHAEAYPLAPLVTPWSAGEALAAIRTLADERGWEVAAADAEDGVLEATATTFWFRFKDDIAFRVRPTADGAGSVIDIRSVSRIGIGDLGANYKRIKAAQDDLKAMIDARAGG